MSEEEWRPIPGYDLYEISESGEVRNIVTGHVKSQLPNGGRMQVKLNHNTTGKVHRLVAAAFIGEPTGPVVRHLDGNFRNNHYSNLAYGTQADNYQDAVLHGTLPVPRVPPTHCAHGHKYTDA